MKAVVHYDRLVETCTVLVEALRQGSYPYDIARRPQDYVSAEIREDPKRLANFFFGVCHYMRSTIQSDFAIRQIDTIALKHPEVFDPAFLSRLNDGTEYVFERMKPYLQYRLFEIPRLWLENFRRLESDWGGDARNIFDGITDSAELYRRVVNIESIPKGKRQPDKLPGFLGFRSKMANMLAYFLMDAQVVKEFTTSTPFDFHNARSLIATGALELTGKHVRYEDVEGLGHEAVERFAKEHRVSMVTLCDALWCLSTTACRFAPGNRTLGRRREKDDKERHTLEYRPQAREELDLTMYAPDWSIQANVLRHEQSCARCPLGKNGMCSTNVTAGFYYENGEFMTQPRTEPIPGLFNGSLPHILFERTEEPPQRIHSPVELPLLPGEWPLQKRPEQAAAAE